jgi:sugar phosphate isomerase/epimerase
MKLGLHSVSYLGLWYDGPALAPLEFLRHARQLGFEGVELDGRRPHANPMDLDHGRRRAIRELGAELQLEVAAIAAHSDLSSPILEHREAQLLLLREQIRLARDLGAPLVRVTLAWPGVTVRDGLGDYDIARRRFDELWRDTTWLEAWNTCKGCLREVVRCAEDEGIVLALANQPPVVRTYRDVLDMIAEVGSPWLRVCIDAHLLERQDAEHARQVALDAAPLQIHTHVRGEFARRDDGRAEPRAYGQAQPLPNYPAFVDALRDGGYDGYLCYEFAHPALDSRRQVQSIEYVDEQARLALAFMRDLLRATEAQQPSEPAAV